MIGRIVALLKHGQDPNWSSIYCHSLSSLSFSLLFLLISVFWNSVAKQKILFVGSRRPPAPGALRQLPHRSSRSYATGLLLLCLFRLFYEHIQRSAVVVIVHSADDDVTLLHAHLHWLGTCSDKESGLGLASNVTSCIVICARVTHRQTVKQHKCLKVRSYRMPCVACLPAPSLGWCPRGQGPSRNRQGPGKNNWTDHVPLPSGLPDKNFGILGHFWY